MRTAFTVSVTVLGVAAGAWVVWRTTDALLVTAAALLLAVALNQVVEWLERHGVPRGAGIALVMLALLAAFVGLGFAIVPPAVDQVTQLVEAWPRLLDAVQRSSLYAFASRHVDLADLVARAERVAPAALGTFVTVLRGSATVGVGLVTVLFVTLFMLTSGRSLVRAALALVSPERRARYAQVTHEIYRALGGYVAGHVFIVAVQAVATSGVLAILGVPFFLPLGLLSAIASLIPFAGVTLMGTVVTAVAWAARGLWAGLAVAGYFLVYQQLESHVLSPIVYRRAVAVNPLATVLAALFLVELGGIPGAILSVPIVAVGHVLVRELTALGRGRPVPPPEPPEDEGPGAELDRRESTH